MFAIFTKIWKYRCYFRSLLYSIYFNFRFLPFKQAIHLPILLYKPSFKDLKGNFIIDCEYVKMGMIQLGPMLCSLYPNRGIIIENHGGTVVFKGICNIGNASAISVGKNGYLEFGYHFKATSQFRCVAYHYVKFGEKCQFGWDCLVMDTDLHKLKKESGGYTKGYGCVKLGNSNWIGSRSFILKNTETSDFCIVAGGSRVSGKLVYEKKVVIGNSDEIKILKDGVYLDIFDDVIEYEPSLSTYEKLK
jgi:acetyltransferase-like isoleucine patch superfamily enzyme